MSKGLWQPGRGPSSSGGDSSPTDYVDILGRDADEDVSPPDTVHARLRFRQNGLSKELQVSLSGDAYKALLGAGGHALENRLELTYPEGASFHTVTLENFAGGLILEAADGVRISGGSSGNGGRLTLDIDAPGMLGLSGNSEAALRFYNGELQVSLGGSAWENLIRESTDQTGGGGGSPLAVQDGGSPVSSNPTALNFVGATSVLESGGVVTVTIPSGGGGGGSSVVVASAAEVIPVNVPGSGGYQALSFTSEQVDTGTGLSGDTYTFPENGYYVIEAAIPLAAAVTSGQLVDLYLEMEYSGSQPQQRLDRIRYTPANTTTDNALVLQGRTAALYFTAGQTVRLMLANDGVADVDVQSLGHITIQRVDASAGSGAEEAGAFEDFVTINSSTPGADPVEVGNIAGTEDSPTASVMSLYASGRVDIIDAPLRIAHKLQLSGTFGMPRGRVTITAGNNSVTVTNSAISETDADGLILTLMSNDATLQYVNGVITDGQLVITGNANATADVTVFYMVVGLT